MDILDLFLEILFEKKLEIAIAIITIFYTTKFLKLVHKIYQSNKLLSNISTNQAFPAKLFGFYQPHPKLERWALFRKLAEAEADADAEGTSEGSSGLSKFYILPFTPILIVSKSDPAETILKSTIHVNKNDIINKVVNSMVGCNLFSATNETWKNKRRILAKTMHRDLHFGYGEAINKHVIGMVDVIKGEISGPSSSSRSANIKFSDLEQNCSLNILADNIFGQKIKNEAQRSKFLSCFDKNIEFLELRISNPLLVNDTIWSAYCFWKGIDYKKIREDGVEIIVEMIKSRMEILKSRSEDQVDQKNQKETLVIDVLLKLYNQKLITFDEIIAEATMFFVAALDTTTHATIGGVYGLSHPSCRDAQEKLINEIDKFFPDKSDLENFQLEILDSMPYLDAVVRESLRYRTGSLIGRSASEKIVFDLKNSSEKIEINASKTNPVNFILNFRAISDSKMLKTYPNNPEELRKFRPDRFFNKEIDTNSYAYLPFSRGPRDCVGQAFAYLSMKIQFIQLYRNFRTEILVENDEDKRIDRECILNFTYQFKVQPVIRFIERD